MDEVFSAVIGLLIGLVFLALIGHGLWLMFAAIVRAITGSPGSKPLAPAGPCSVCGDPRGVVGPRCQSCGAPASVPDSQRDRMELLAVKRRIQRWAANGQLPPGVLETITQLLVADENGPKPASPPQITVPKAAPLPMDQAPPRATAAPVAASTGPLVDEPIYVADVVDAEVINSPAVLAPFTSPAHHTTQPIVAPAPRRTFADMLQAFMEQRNIRWVEIISGTLIVVSAVGLVISLRATLKDTIPYFPALMFLLVTAAIHGAGIYSLRRWDLKRSSRGMLIIGTLLVPLSFLASIILSGTGERQRAATDPIFLAAVFVGGVSFTWMNYLASRVLLRHSWWRLMVSVLGTSFSQLFIHRIQSNPSSPLMATALLAVPVASFLIPNLMLVVETARRYRLGTRSAQQFFLELGIGLFAVLAPVGLYIANADSKTSALGDLSPVLSLVACALVASGLVVQQRAASERTPGHHPFGQAVGLEWLVGGHSDPPTVAAASPSQLDSTSAPADSLSGYRLAGTSLAIFGAGCMLLLVAFAWPQLELLTAVGLINFALLSVLAAVARLPLLHTSAIGCLGLAFLSAFHIWRGVAGSTTAQLSAQIVHATFTGESGVALAGFSICIGAMGGILRRRSPWTAQAYWLASAAVVLLCLAVGLYAGFFAPPLARSDLATLILLFCAVAPLVVAGVTQIARFAWIGTVLLLVAVFHGLSGNQWLQTQLHQGNWWPDEPLLQSLMGHSVLASLLATVGTWRWPIARQANSAGAELGQDKAESRGFALPLATSALITSVACAVMALVVTQERYLPHAVYLLGASLAWLHFHPNFSPRRSFAVFQVLATLAVAYATTGWCARQVWWQGSLLSAGHVHMQVAVGGAWCCIWSLISRLLDRRSEPIRWWPAEPPVDLIVSGFLSVCVLALSLQGAIPGTLVEMGLEMPLRVSAISPHRLWYSGGAWWGVGLVLCAWIARLWSGHSRLAVAAIVITTAAIPALIAGTFDDDLAVASALRWFYAIFAVAWCVSAFVYGGNQPSHVQPFGRRSRARPADVIRWISLGCSAFGVLVLTTAAVWSIATGHLPHGPVINSFFEKLGSAANFAVPLFLLVGILAIYAVRESKPSYAMAGSLVFQYAVSLACLLPWFARGSPIDELAVARLMQWNLVGLAFYTTAWIGVLQWREPDRLRVLSLFAKRNLLAAQIGIFLVAQLVVAGWIALVFVFDPLARGTGIETLGQPLSYLALLVGWGGLGWLLRRGPLSMVLHGAALALLVLVHFFAASMLWWGGTGTWWGHHALSAARIVLAAMLASAAFWIVQHRLGGEPTWSRARRVSVRWASVAVVLAVLSALRGAVDDPLRPAWSTGIMALSSVVTVVLGVCSRSQWLAYFSAILSGLTASVFCFGLSAAHPLLSGNTFVAFHIIALSLAALVWLGWEIYFQRRGEAGLAPTSFLPPLSTAVGRMAVPSGTLYVMGLALLICVVPQVTHMSPLELTVVAGAWIAMLALFGGSLWDRRAHYSIPGLYVWSLGVAVFVVSQLTLSPTFRLVTLLGIAATHVAISGWIWSWGSKLAVVGRRVGIADPVEILRRVSFWLPIATLALAAGVSVFSVLLVLSSEWREVRVTAASLPMLLAAGTAGLAQMQRRDAMQLLSLIFLSLGGALLGLADIAPQWSDQAQLLRAFRLLMALSALTFLFGVVLVRWLSIETGWRQAARRAAVLMGGLASVVLMGVMLLEWAMFQPGVDAPVGNIHVIAVSLVLVALVVALLSLAILPGRDPLGLSEKGRMGYVYAAQVMSGLLFAHIYLAKASLFTGILRDWWPYIVLAIAFVGVGVGEVFQRFGWRVLAEPFQRSGAFLPLVPAIGMWMSNTSSSYSHVLFLAGVLYLLISFAHKSQLAGAAAALAGNGGLWSLLEGTEDLTFSQHPQFWLIPPAVSVLIATQINRRHLSDVQLATIRYVAVSVIYVSSVVEMLSVGIGRSLWPPVILISLALLGVFLGIALRVRAFLYLGAIFVLVGLVSMVAHASRSIQQVWPWWVFLLTLGVVLLIVFGWFEGRRAQILALVERLRQWEK